MKQEDEYIKKVKLLRTYDETYRVGSPIATDHGYDQLEQEVIALEAEIPVEKRLEGPHNRITDVTTGIQSMHISPMLSQRDVFNFEDALKFMGSVTGNKVAQYKMDGFALNLIYKMGSLYRAITRGDGEIGQDVTEKVLKCFADIPKNISIQDTIEIRGEGYIPYKDFYRMNTNSKYSNPRNLAVGTLGLNDLEEIKVRGLSFMAFGIASEDNLFKSETEKLKFLKSNKFVVVPSVPLKDDDLIEFHDHLVDLRPDLEFMIDGIVIKADSTKVQKKMGVNNKYPRHSVALKFPPESRKTTVTDIVFQLGMDKLTPVAILKPIRLNDTVVGRVTLHNLKMARESKIGVGAKVDMIKSGDIIPKIIKVYPSRRRLVIPTECPSCSFPLEETDVDLICPNLQCGGKELFRLIRFASKPYMNMKGISSSIITTLYEAGKLKRFIDFFLLTRQDLTMFAKTTQTNILSAIALSTRVEEHRVLAGMGINGVGRTASKLILQEQDLSKLIDIPGIGPVTSSNFIEWWKNNESSYLHLLTKLELIQGQSDKDFKRVGITGAFDIPRAKIEELLKEQYMKIATVGKNNDFIMIGKNPSKSKLDKIKGYDIPRLELF